MTTYGRGTPVDHEKHEDYENDGGAAAGGSVHAVVMGFL